MSPEERGLENGSKSHKVTLLPEHVEAYELSMLRNAFREGWLARRSLITSAPQVAEELEEEINEAFVNWLRSAQDE